MTASRSQSVCTTLAQLRSGHCQLLNSYKARITSGISDVCPECGVAPTVKAIRHNLQCKTCGTTRLQSQTSSTWTTDNRRRAAGLSQQQQQQHQEVQLLLRKPIILHSINYMEVVHQVQKK